MQRRGADANHEMNALTSPLRWALFAVNLIFLVACQKPDVRYSKTLDRESLMRLPYPTWQASGAGKVQQVDLSAISRGNDYAQASKTRAFISPMYVVRLDDTHAVMVTETWPTTKGDELLDCHACSGTIGAYFFENSASGWRLSSHQDAVAHSGANGNIGETKITKLANGHFALTAEWGSTWFGYSGSWLVVVGLKADKASLLESGIPLSIDNDGAHGACSELDNPTEGKEEAQPQECLDIRSQWKFQGESLLIDFAGRLSKLGPDGKLLPTRKIAQQARYGIAANQLNLTKGVNPVPGF